MKYLKYFGSSFKQSAGWKVASSGVLLDSQPEKNRDPDQPQQSLGAHRALAAGLPRQLLDVQQGSWGPPGQGYKRNGLAFASFERDGFF